MLGQVEDPAAATLEWSSLLLRSFLMEAGLSMVEMEAPYMGYYLEAATGGTAPAPAAAVATGVVGLDPSSVAAAAAAAAAAGYVRLEDKLGVEQGDKAEVDQQRHLLHQHAQIVAQQQQQHHHQHHHGHHLQSVPPPSVVTSVVQGCGVMQQHQGIGMGGSAMVAHDDVGVVVGGATTGNVVAGSRPPWMDPRLWSRLPEKLVERVLACLPLASFFRMRLVCKRWYNLLFSDSFLEACAKVSPRRPWFLLFRQGEWSEAVVFDPVGRAWFKLDLACVLPPRFSVVASSGGLLCCISEARGCKTVLICNPITRACVQLPQALKERFVPTVGLVVDPATKAYRVMAAGDDLISPFAVKNLTTEFYDSRLQQWCMTAPLPRLCNLESGKTTYANGFFYCMNYSPFSVLAYDTEQGVWSKIQAPMRRFLRTPNLVECRGRLVLVAAVEKNKLNVPKSIRIWGLQHSKTSWVELERMPQALYEEFMRVSGQKAFHCIGHGNLILITLSDSAEMLIYDFYEKVWRWAPRCPFRSHGGTNGSPGVDDGGGGGFLAFPFDPRLEASVY